MSPVALIYPDHDPERRKGFCDEYVVNQRPIICSNITKGRDRSLFLFYLSR